MSSWCALKAALENILMVTQIGNQFHILQGFKKRKGKKASFKRKQTEKSLKI